MAEGSSAPLWFSAATFFGGLISSQLLEFWKDYRGSKRERETRVENRAITQLDRRNEFQRQTLVALQDELLRLARTTGEMYSLDRIAHSKSGERWAHYPEDLDSENSQSQARCTVLGARIRDEQTRQLFQTFSDTNIRCFLEADMVTARTIHNQAVRAFDSLQKRIGVVLRELDDSEAAGGLKA